MSRRVYVLIFGMKCIVHLGLQHATINAAKTNFAPLLKSAWHRSTNLRDGMGCLKDGVDSCFSILHLKPLLLESFGRKK